MDIIYFFFCLPRYPQVPLIARHVKYGENGLLGVRGGGVTWNLTTCPLLSSLLNDDSENAGTDVDSSELPLISEPSPSSTTTCLLI
jgi:hypothetical protein